MERRSVEPETPAHHLVKEHDQLMKEYVMMRYSPTFQEATQLTVDEKFELPEPLLEKLESSCSSPFVRRHFVRDKSRHPSDRRAS